MTHIELRDQRRQTEANDDHSNNKDLEIYTQTHERFIAGDIEEASFNLNESSLTQIIFILNLFLPQFQNGERYVMSIGSLYYTLTLE